MKVLITGDLHLGRSSTRMGGVGSDELASPTTGTWEAVVRWAVTEGVDVLALTGDLVDRENRFYEAFGPLERGLAELAGAGVEVVAVAGNHDFDVLPRLAGHLAGGFHLVGAGGRWERLLLPRGGQAALAVDGWSFPAGHVDEDPLAGYDLPAEEQLPTLGLLHADVAQVTSRYAPVPLERLERLPVTAWLLGHVHAPRRLAEGPPLVLYPGSPQALDVREEGVHGPWLLDLDGRRVRSLEQIPLSPVRYERLEVDLAGAASRQELEERVLTGLGERLAAAVEEGRGHLSWLVCQLRLVGATTLHDEVAALTAHLDQLSRTRDDARALVDRVTVDTRPPVALADLARARDAAGELARRLLALEGGTAAGAALLARAGRRLEQVHAAAAYDGVRDDPPATTEEARTVLLSAGYRLLDALLAQR